MRCAEPFIDPSAQVRLRLSKVSFHHVDHFISRQGLLRIRFSLGVQHVMPDMAFEQFGHQAVNCASCRLMICNTSEQSRPSSRIRSKASNCPRMRLLRKTSFCLFLIV
jgi:hypothetical protein